MDEKLLALKLAVAAFFSSLGGFLGWKGVMFFIWLGAMALDYLSGTCAAVKNGEWDSTVARQGLWHKFGMILVVVVGAIADALFVFMLPRLPLIDAANPGFLLPLVLAWYIITEAGSVLENAVKLGASYPAWLTKALKIGLKAVDKAGDEAAGREDAVPYKETEGASPFPTTAEAETEAAGANPLHHKGEAETEGREEETNNE